MHLKSLKITNFRKFGKKNNVIEFVGAKGDPLKPGEINIAPSTTLIVGKNNSGKTTVIEALKKLITENKFQANDFNFIYLNSLLKGYLKGSFEQFPSLEFEVQVAIDFNSNCDLVTNIAPFMNIENVTSGDKERDCQIILKYEIKETTKFVEETKLLISKYKDKSILFRKFLEIVNSTEFKLNCYDSKGALIDKNKFKLNDLFKIKVISANKIIDDKSLSKTFNRIINFRYKAEKNRSASSTVDSEIEKINKKITTSVSKAHTKSINKALGKIESSDRLEVELSADLTFDTLMTNIIKYEYKEGELYIPEEQFGLGYSSLMTIIGELIDYIERYPQQECHSKVNLICIEEPEAFMHSQMQELFIKHINDAISYLIADMKKEINSQLIITTHSSHILNSKIHSGNSFNNISYITIVDNFSNVVNLNDENVMEDVNASEAPTEIETPVETPVEIPVETPVETPVEKKMKEKNLSDDLKFLKKHIKYKVSELFFSDAVIFVEGVTEETLLSYYIDQDEELNKYYISIFNINGAHGLVYHPLIKLLKVPTLIITDLDIKRTDIEKESHVQISDLNNLTTTNKTIVKYNPNKEKIDNLSDYFEDDNLFVVFQLNAVEGYFATSFEESFILANYKNDILNAVLEIIKPNIYKGIVGNPIDKENLKEKSYELQKKISGSKSDFSNELLYRIVVNDDVEAIPILPKYIKDGLIWLKSAVKNQVKGGTES
ncbi:MAG: AAA family ATPase [Planctomycetes bacterium]|nr:AAA family ATPase [Planctomycetota bacterium]